MWTCRVYVALREFEEEGEGAVSNVQQVVDLAAELRERDGRFPLHYFIDDVSGRERPRRAHLLAERTRPNQTV